MLQVNETSSKRLNAIRVSSVQCSAASECVVGCCVLAYLIVVEGKAPIAVWLLEDRAGEGGALIDDVAFDCCV